MEFDIAYAVDSPYVEGLNRAVQILIKDSVLAMITATVKWCQFIPNEENAIVSRIRFDPNNRGASIRPGLDSRLHSHRATNR